MLNDEIKDYWEGESYVYSDIIKKSLDDEGKNAWADLPRDRPNLQQPL